MILAVALFMEQMDSTVIATSLPAIAADIGTSPIALKLAVTSYLVALAIFIPISGWMSDRFGARNIFRMAIFVFMIGSVACAFSNSIAAFVVARLIQGAGGSMMTPVSRLLLVRGTPRHELVDAMAWLTIPALIGPIMGPPIGGFLTTYLTWHWIFWINVPIGVLGIILVTRFLPAVEPRSPRPMDFPGFFLCGIGFSGFVFGLSVISLPAVPVIYGYVTVAVGILAGLLYLLHARRAPYPLLDPKMFRYPMFRAAILGASNFRMGLGALPFLMPLMLQLGFGLTPLQSGSVTFVSALGSMGSKFAASRTFNAFGFRTVISITTLLAAIFLGINGLFTRETPLPLIMACLLIGGLFRSMAFSGVNAMAFGDVGEADSSQATAINAVAQRISMAMGVAIAGGILEISSSLHGGRLLVSDFHTAFFSVSAISALACITFLRLPRNAGAELTTRRRKHRQAEPEEAMAENSP
ncbi:MFS transporter [Rhizobium redzepovicii]|uniref:MFS transporter n=1 Tax=Rhizobium redzepovicii TaxID=2867518 RepID=UPI00287280DF|nr:MFS transporter [Rhizobium redzepovicii]MDR9785102.1 MFS transporter [Rhizobium redzepovicii]